MSASSHTPDPDHAACDTASPISMPGWPTGSSASRTGHVADGPARQVDLDRLARQVDRLADVVDDLRDGLIRLAADVDAVDHRARPYGDGAYTDARWRHPRRRR